MAKRPQKNEHVFSDEKEIKYQQHRKKITRDVISRKSAKAEFHGLEREFIQFKDLITANYEKSKNIRHIRDLGNEREATIRDFLISSGLIPKKYGISEVSARVVSLTGHISREIDILFYNKLESITLMKYPGVLEHYPVENVYGVIQIKSKLSNITLQDALQNIASYKKLHRSKIDSNLLYSEVLKKIEERGFGIIFAYESDLDWASIYNTLKEWMKSQPPQIWPNAVVVLSKGHFLYGNDKSYLINSSDIESSTGLTLFGFPDRDDSCLYSFYLILMNLLANSSAGAAPFERYFRLPQTADELSYRFSLGASAELGECMIHGRYLREISPANLKKIVAAVEQQESINWIQATDIAYGLPGDNEEAYKRQPLKVKIYNPDDLLFKKILVDGVGLSFDWLEISNLAVWIPYYYSIRDNIFSTCPKCRRRKPKTASINI